MPERILHVIGKMDRAGAETLIMNLYRVIDREKFQFDFLVHTQEKGDYDQEILSLGGKIYRVPSYVIYNSHAYRNACARHFKNHLEHRIVHGHIGIGAPIYLSEAKKAGRRAIAHCHSGNFYTGIMRLAFSIFTYQTRNVAEFFIACSKEACRETFGSGLEESGDYLILKNGIELNTFTCNDEINARNKEMLGLPKNAPVFGHVGRFVEVKNHRFLLKSFSMVVKKLPDAILLLMGKGELERDIMQYSKELGLSDSVFFLGLRDDVSEVLKAIDVFIFPSINEGLGISAIEAQASGAVSVVSTGIPEDAVVCAQTVRIPLEKGEEFWAEECCKAYELAINKPRTDCIDEVREAGFDIEETAKTLICFYESLL